jgi:hypothetical protein
VHGERDSRSEAPMADLIFLAATAAFFALSVLYVLGCERLK